MASPITPCRMDSRITDGKVTVTRSTGPLTLEELSESTGLIVRRVQNEYLLKMSKT